MKYMFLIYSAENSGPKPGTDEFGALMAGYGAFNEQAVASGMMREGAPLEGISSSTTVQVRGGKPSVVDGPFAETKEVLGGYYVLECKDLDEAIAQAAKIPTAAYGSIEIRPVMDMA